MTAEQQDNAARAAVLDRTRSFIVQAPAGSGKTELLIQRYLALLAAVDAPEEILAITFTRKAAAEMRVRVLEALRGAPDPDLEAPHKRLTQQLAREVLKRDGALRWALREQPARMRILTIDALNGWLTRQMPWQSGLGPLSTVTDEAKSFHREAVRTVLLDESADSALRDAVRQLLVHLDNRFAVVESLLVDMLAIRDQWTEVIAGGLDTDAARVLLEHGMERIIREHLRRLVSEFSRAGKGSDVLAESAALALHAARVLQADPERDAREFAAFLDDQRVPDAEPDTLARWQAIRTLLCTEAGGFRSARGVNVRIGFAPGDPEKTRLIALLDAMRDDESVRSLLEGLRELPAPRYDETQWKIVGSIVTILDACLRALREQFTRAAVTDHIEVASAARRALGPDLEPTELAMMLEYRIRHILVDEFQDTSTNQFQLLAQLTAGWSAPDRHTLFLVGDPMQSIYRFREAEVGLFLQVWEQGRLGDVPLDALRLTRNFRSQEGLVRWVNDVFARCMPARNDPAAGAVAYAPSTAVRPSEDMTTDITVEYSGNRAAEARAVAARIRRVLDGEECGMVESVAVLVRARTHLAELVPALRAEGVRFRAVELEPLGESPAVRDLLALVRALVAPADRIAWLSVLRSPCCGLTLADLHALCGGDADTPVPQLLHDPERRARCSPEGLLRIGRVTPILDAHVGRRGRMSLRALVESCWIALGTPALLDTAELDAARTFLALLEQHDDGGDLDDLTLLEERAAKLFAPPDPQGDVRLQLMTIHKAKGLEFDVVVLPRLDGVSRRESDQLLLWDREVCGDRLEFLIAPLRPKGSESDDTYRHIRAKRREKAAHESVRLLYVAATRARRLLLLSATMKESVRDGVATLASPRSESFLALLWQVIEEEARSRYGAWSATDASGSPSASGTTAPGLLLRRVPADWTVPVLPADVPTGEISPGHGRVTFEPSRPVPAAGHTARAVGVVVHELLRRIAMEGESFWTEATRDRRDALIQTLLSGASLPVIETEAIDRVVRAVDRTRTDEKGQWILADTHAEAACELALTAWENDQIVSIRVDRTFVEASGTRWIVDYKTADHEGADRTGFLDDQVRMYREQLLRYARVLRRWDGRPVRAGLYFPLLQEWREVAGEGFDELVVPVSE